MPLLELQELPRLHRFSRVSLLVLYGLRVYAQCLVLGAVLPKMVCNTEVARSRAGSEPAAATGCMTIRKAAITGGGILHLYIACAIDGPF